MEKSDKELLIKELNELSQDFTHNKERMTEIAKILLADHYWYIKTKEDYEYANRRICRHGIQRESCRDCVTEATCHLEEQKARFLDSNE